ncbi:MAG: hypothetical protein AAF601_13525 [Pseudomonadota bacterium]
MADALKYRVFGHILASDVPLRVLQPAPAEAVVTLRVKLRAGMIRPELTDSVTFDITPERQFFQWQAVGAFLIEDDPSIIWVEPNPGAPAQLVAQPLLGIVISVALERLGTFCLHGGAVDVGGSAAIFVGDKGAGKSTTVSALLDAEHRLLTDDLVALTADAGTGGPVVHPAFAAVKLWPDSLNALSMDPDQTAQTIHPSITKLQKTIEVDLPTRPVPAGGIFVLAPNRDGRTEAVRLDRSEALSALFCFAFISRFGTTSLGKSHMAGLMQHCGNIVRTTPVYTLHVARDFARMSDLVEAITRAVPGMEHKQK